jgi:NitT/TauT family transport system substrate-binding protein
LNALPQASAATGPRAEGAAGRPDDFNPWERTTAMTKTLLAALAALSLAGTASAPDLVRFGTNWVAGSGHGGFYQSIADGTYAEHGLEVEIVMGGPQVNNRPLLSAGRLDFLMGDNLLLSFDNVRNEIPTIVVAAFFQRDPQILMAHAGEYAGWEDLVNAPTILVSRNGQISYWQWLTKAHGFRDEQLRPYAFNLVQYLSDPKTVQQGYATSEPVSAANSGAVPEVFILVDYGWSTYSTTLETRTELVETNPELVQRFIDASIIGWYNFLYGDRAAAYELIMRDNPDASIEKLESEVAQLLGLDIVDSGRALEHGIGAMDMERVADFLKLAEESRLIPPGSVDMDLVATDRFINRGVGMDLRKE